MSGFCQDAWYLPPPPEHRWLACLGRVTRRRDHSGLFPSSQPELQRPTFTGRDRLTREGQPPPPGRTVWMRVDKRWAQRHRALLPHTTNHLSAVHSYTATNRHVLPFPGPAPSQQLIRISSRLICAHSPLGKGAWRRAGLCAPCITVTVSGWGASHPPVTGSSSLHLFLPALGTQGPHGTVGGSPVTLLLLSGSGITKSPETSPCSTLCDSERPADIPMPIKRTPAK